LKKFVGGVAVLLLAASCSTNSVDAPPVTAALAGTRSSAAQLSAGRTVFVNRCIECHTLPRIHEHAAADWPRIVNKMSGRANLTPAEHEALVAYVLAVRQHAR
jgi:mono/diheme cytochrome c family protein